MSGNLRVEICGHTIELSENTVRSFESLNELLSRSAEDLLELDPKAQVEQGLTEKFHDDICRDVERYIENSGLSDEEHDVLMEYVSEQEIVDEVLEQLDGQSR